MLPYAALCQLAILSKYYVHFEIFVSFSLSGMIKNYLGEARHIVHYKQQNNVIWTKREILSFKKAT